MLFRLSKPGHRFRDRYRRRQQQGHDRLRKALNLGCGLLLIFISTILGWAPIFGWGTAFLGMGLIAGEFRPAAHLLDWLEVRARRMGRPLARAWRQSSVARALIASTLLLCTAAMAYGFFYVFVGI